MGQLLDGRALAAEIRAEVAERVARLAAEGVGLGLVAVQVGADPGAAAYGRTLRRACEEVGLGFEVDALPEDTRPAGLLARIQAFNGEADVHGLLVQRPLPSRHDPHEVAEAVAPEKDVDGLHPLNLGRLLAGRPGLAPATPLAVRELLLRFDHAPAGRHVVVIGRSDIVGKPLAALLVQKDPRADATVTVSHSRTVDLRRHTRAADILVVAVGRPEFLRKEMVREGVVVVDVGINSVPDPERPGRRKLVGDVAFDEVAPVAGAITPVPGGVGPVTVALLLRNTLQAYTLQEEGFEGAGSR